MPKTEKALLAFAIVALIAAIASRLLFPQIALQVLYLVIVSQVVLLGFYITHSTSLIYRILFAAFILGWLGTLFELFHQPYWRVVYSFKYFSELALGILMLFKIGLFLKKDGFQLFTFLHHVV